MRYGYLAVAAMLPYLFLKIAWLAGSDIGVNEPGMMNTPGMLAANAVTGGMELAGALIAVALTQRWGQRLPGWLVTFPMWVGTGLLVPILMTVPAGMALGAMSAASDELQPWVYLVVYGGFCVQGVALILAFGAYTKRRWPGAFAAGPGVAGPARPLQATVAKGMAALCALSAVLGVYWLLGGSAGRPDAYRYTTVQVLSHVAEVLLVLAAAAGLAMLVFRYGRPGLGAALAWTGSGAMFAGGVMGLLPTLLGAVEGSGLGDVAALANGLTGVTIALSAAFVLAERQAAAEA
ncbi:hypothetical protein [Longispora albida]|uniref:hypothetical protein n=1 Tax=Longispora albida TaxID=203523 RepID=UPI000379B461|nr:hypothetical protein [Longispora albida]